MNNTEENIKSTRERVSYLLSILDRASILRDILEIMAVNSQSVLNVEANSLGAAGFVRIITEDPSETAGHEMLRHVCRGLQAVNGCNHLQAIFLRRNSAGAPQQFSSYHRKSVPFESFFSGQLIKTTEPIHPENALESDLNNSLYELDKAAAGFIKDPERLLLVNPSDLEKIVAEIYRGHGFDVRVLGGPKY